MKTILILTIILGAYTIGAAAFSNVAVMEKCQQTFSYDVCFQQLNR